MGQSGITHRQVITARFPPHHHHSYTASEAERRSTAGPQGCPQQ